VEMACLNMHTVFETVLNIVPYTSMFLWGLNKYHQGRLMKTVNVQVLKDKLLFKQLQNIASSFYTHLLEVHAKFYKSGLKNIEIKSMLT